MIYLDASVLFKRYCDEPGSAEIRRIADAATALATAVLSYVEVFSALRRKLSEGGIDERHYRRAAGQFETDWADLEVIPLTDEVLRLARHVIERHHLRAGDAVQLASALTFSATVPTYFASADRRLAQAAEREGLAVVSRA